MNRPVGIVLLAALFLLMSWFFFPFLRTAFLSALLTAEVVKPESNLLERFTPEPSVAALSFPYDHRMMRADLYRPPDNKIRAGIILNHGVILAGKDDPRLVSLAKSLARVGFAVLVPEFKGMKELKVKSSDTEEIIAAFNYFSTLKGVDPGRIGIFSFSYAAGPMLMAAADERIRDKVRFLVSFGGYYDVKELIIYSLTGHYEYEGRAFYHEPEEYNRWVLLHNYLDVVEPGPDRDILAEIDRLKSRDKYADISPFVKKLKYEGKSVMKLFLSPDPGEVKKAISQLPPGLQKEIEDLSPSRAISRIRAHLILAHGYSDPSIPYTQTLKLAQAVADKNQVKVGIFKLFVHVDPSLAKPTLKNVTTLYIPEGISLYALLFDLLSQQPK